MFVMVAALLFTWTPASQPVSIPDTTTVIDHRANPAATKPSSAPADAQPSQPTGDKAAQDVPSGPGTSLSAPTDAQTVAAMPSDAAPRISEISANYTVLSSIRIADPAALRNSRFIDIERAPSRRLWLALAVAQHGAAAFDAYSTRDAIGHGAVEENPVMRPFANSSAMYAAIQVMPIALDYTARKMQRTSNPLLRRMWWVPQAVSTAGFIFSGAHNLRVAGQP